MPTQDILPHTSGSTPAVSEDPTATPTATVEVEETYWKPPVPELNRRYRLTRIGDRKRSGLWRSDYIKYGGMQFADEYFAVYNGQSSYGSFIGEVSEPLYTEMDWTLEYRARNSKEWKELGYGTTRWGYEIGESPGQFKHGAVVSKFDYMDYGFVSIHYNESGFWDCGDTTRERLVTTNYFRSLPSEVVETAQHVVTAIEYLSHELQEHADMVFSKDVTRALYLSKVPRDMWGKLGLHDVLVMSVDDDSELPTEITISRSDNGQYPTEYAE
jgi:hypothetical protein